MKLTWVELPVTSARNLSDAIQQLSYASGFFL